MAASGRGAPGSSSPGPSGLAYDVYPHTPTVQRTWREGVEASSDSEQLDQLSFVTPAELRRLADGRAVDQVTATVTAPDGADAGATLFEARLAAIPYAPAVAFLGREKAKLARREGEPLRLALVADAVGAMHGVTHTLDEVRDRSVPGFEVEVVEQTTASTGGSPPSPRSTSRSTPAQCAGSCARATPETSTDCWPRSSAGAPRSRTCGSGHARQAPSCATAFAAQTLQLERLTDTRQPIFCASSTMIPAGPRT